MNFLLLFILLITELAAQSNNLFDPTTGTKITDSLKVKYDPQTGILIKKYTDEEILYFASNDVSEFYTLQKEIKWSVLGGGASMLSMGPGLVLSVYIYYNGNFPDSTLSNPICCNLPQGLIFPSKFINGCS